LRSKSGIEIQQLSCNQDFAQIDQKNESGGGHPEMLPDFGHPFAMIVEPEVRPIRRTDGAI